MPCEPGNVGIAGPSTRRSTAPAPPLPRRPGQTTTIALGAVDDSERADLVDDGLAVEPGDPDAVLPADDFATGALIRRDGDGPSALRNRELLVPMATGLCVLAWALHLRYLARQAAQAPALIPMHVTPLSDEPAPPPPPASSAPEPASRRGRTVLSRLSLRRR